MKKITVIMSESNTSFGAFVVKFTKFRYGHCSLKIDGEIYSYCRIIEKLWFTACFTREHYSRYKMYKEYDLYISDAQYAYIRKEIERMKKKKLKLYNYFQLFATPLGKEAPLSGCYTCSGFLASLFNHAKLTKFKKPLARTPEDIYNFLEHYSQKHNLPPYESE
ncbi:MAG: hypothetical protein MJ105_01435 [Lachnospiraceae bacterium]|nr:hypothetical protein [Lachnospiraceae bacterium]